MSFALSYRSTQHATFGLAFMPNIRICMATAVSFLNPSAGRFQRSSSITGICIDDATSIAVNGDPLAAFLLADIMNQAPSKADR
ncbi:hypothetical protein B0H14DRAFT_3469813 [Mycena olivaceomarginata]|nr:hypothetical protein B0H14DRAFT_3469813 [Mycena olivaceomarginata]